MDWKTKAKLSVGIIGVGLAAATAWTALDRVKNHGTERVPYKTVERIDGVELRRYPETIRVRTTASNGREAFFRLFNYIDGANEGSTSVSMTTPVETGTDTRAAGDAAGDGASETGESISMTAPVETTREDGATMSFFLPATYTPETAPEPTNDDVKLVVDPPRTLAALRFSWWAPRFRVSLKERTLRTTLAQAGIEPTGEPRLLRYDAPFTPPWLRTNEVVVEVDTVSVRRALT
ncbi:SOUL heme-binding protein [Haloferax sp. Atlit-10N]|uniref:SOUL family heme-binding protein n=1 Tax=unclassified Haloferax TaxID=2625095 RepID=UPI000E226720|nr:MULTISPECIES: heme-binding protein [unclassified Haloferax]RDZ44832.1 SOUL heme-binding protein [Haloferax sp. Atlit-16N]RDZ59389.1 SOUL heme-binding protein [Haloferax sp. Atlit-10N]